MLLNIYSIILDEYNNSVRSHSFTKFKYDHEHDSVLFNHLLLIKIVSNSGWTQCFFPCYGIKNPHLFGCIKNDWLIKMNGKIIETLEKAFNLETEKYRKNI